MTIPYSRRHLLGGALLLLAAACAAPERAPVSERPLLRFGLIADVQYADKPDAGARTYRQALPNLEGAVEDLSRQELDRVLQLGDIIDGRDGVEGSRIDLARVLERFERLDVPLHHVLGNHCFSVPRDELLASLGLEAPYYAFSSGGLRFVVVDSQQLSVCGWSEGRPEHRRGSAWLEAHGDQPNAKPWNGGLGDEQRAWLAGELARAERAGERVVGFSHHPVLPASSTPGSVLWDHEQVRELLLASPATLAWFNGHDHAGGYAREGGVHFVTLRALMESAPEQNAYCVVEVWPDRLELIGVGEQPSRTLTAER